MLKSLTSALMLSFITCSTFASIPVVSGAVGNVKGIVDVPRAIVFENSLVLFYQLNSNKTQIAFSIATANADGSLTWEHQYNDNYSYVVNTSRLTSQAVSPSLAMLNGKLYVFGRSSDKKLIYNAVDTLGNLRGDQNWNSTSPHTLRNQNQSDLILADNLKGMAALEYFHTNNNNSPAERRLLLTYFDKNPEGRYTYSSCKPDIQSSTAVLYCEGAGVNLYNQKYDSAPHLTNVAVSKNLIKPYLFIRNTDSSIDTHYFAPSEHGWGPHVWYSQNGPKLDQVKTSANPVGTAETEETGTIYYQAKDTDKIYESTGWLGGNAWSKGTPVMILVDEKEQELKMGAPKGVASVVYNNRSYIFYVDKETGNLSYYSGKAAEEPVLASNP